MSHSSDKNDLPPRGLGVRGVVDPLTQASSNPTIVAASDEDNLLDDSAPPVDAALSKGGRVDVMITRRAPRPPTNLKASVVPRSVVEVSIEGVESAPPVVRPVKILLATKMCERADEELWVPTTQSLGDAVVVTDGDGRHLFAVYAAFKVTGIGHPSEVTSPVPVSCLGVFAPLTKEAAAAWRTKYKQEKPLFSEVFTLALETAFATAPYISVGMGLRFVASTPRDKAKAAADGYDYWLDKDHVCVRLEWDYSQCEAALAWRELCSSRMPRALKLFWKLFSPEKLWAAEMGEKMEREGLLDAVMSPRVRERLEPITIAVLKIAGRAVVSLGSISANGSRQRWALEAAGRPIARTQVGATFFQRRVDTLDESAVIKPVD